TRRERYDERRYLRHQPVSNRQTKEHIQRPIDGKTMTHHADHDSTTDVDGSDDQPGDRIPAHKLRRTVHSAIECALILDLAAPAARLLFVDKTSRQICVDCHLLAGHR